MAGESDGWNGLFFVERAAQPLETAMPIKEDLLEILCCPKTMERLRPVAAEVLARINERIASGQVRYEGVADGSYLEMWNVLPSGDRESAPSRTFNEIYSAHFINYAADEQSRDFDEEGEMLIMPADVPHELKARQAFKMMLTMIRV